MKSIQIVEECVGFSAGKLAVLAGLLTPVVGIDRAIIAIDLANGLNPQNSEYQFFSFLVELLGSQCNQKQWYRAIDCLRKLKVVV